MSSTSPNGLSDGVGVEVRGLRASYGSQEVLHGISFQVRPGEIFVIMGPSGSGKSVLLKHLIGLEVPQAGEVLIGGASIAEPGTMDRCRMAMVFQSGGLLNSLTVSENVGLYPTEHRTHPPKEIDRLVAEKLELVGLKGIEAKYPSELSGGMRKRVSIARALVIEPQLILYDEPTSELDPLSALTISEEIVALNERMKVTSIVVTHDRDLAFAVADRIAVLDRGEIRCSGTPAEIRRHGDPMVQRFLTADFRKEHSTL
jgi:phospholipid/cholesterol/gamma-HCH transport system ATP-binding protein